MEKAGRTAAKISDVAAQEGFSQGTVRLGTTGGRLLRTIHSSKVERIGFYNRGGHVDLRIPFFTQLVTGLYDGCYATGNSLLLHTHKPDASPQAVYDTLVSSGTAGLIVKTLPSDPLLPLLIKAPLPIVAVVDALPGLPSVVSDDMQGAGAIAAHLASKGHQHIFFQRSTVPHTSVERRLASLQTESNLGNFRIEVGEVPDTEAGGMCTGLKEALLRPKETRPTAVVCWDDRNALSVLSECRAMALRVPGDIAVVGYDDGVGALHFGGDGRRLTTVRAEWGAVAREAVYGLMTLLEGGEMPPETVLPCRFIAGDST